MSATQFTPGPWRVLNPDQVRGPEGEFVASCSCHSTRLDADMANARLIAAAPELLSECERFLYLLNNSSTPGQITQTKEGIAQLRSAIARAKGTP